jgi:hypothetical protein
VTPSAWRGRCFTYYIKMFQEEDVEGTFFFLTSCNRKWVVNEEVACKRLINYSSAVKIIEKYQYKARGK